MGYNLKDYYFGEFVRNTLQSAGVRTDLNTKYILNLYNGNKSSTDKKSVFAIAIKWYAENRADKLPNFLTPENGFSSELILNGIKIVKNEELILMLEYLYDEYMQTKRAWNDYYALQEKEALKCLADKKYKSDVLTEIASKKSISVDELVAKILDNVKIHNAIILNRKFLLKEMGQEIENKTLSELYEFEIIDEIQKRLFNA